MAEEPDENAILKDVIKKENIMPKFSSSSIVVESISDSEIRGKSDFSEKNHTNNFKTNLVMYSSSLSKYNPSSSSFDQSQTVGNSNREDSKNSELIVTELSKTGVILESSSDTDTDCDSDNSDTNNALSAVTSEPTCSAGPVQPIEASQCIGTINVSDSKDVHVGTKTIINGTVIIKQFMQAKTEEIVDSGGISNQAFVTTASDLNSLNLSVRSPHQEYHHSKCKGILWIEKRWGIDLRCKAFLFSLFCICIIILICIMFVVVIERTKMATVLTPSLNKANEPYETSNGSNRLQGCWYIDYFTSVLLSIGFLALCCTILTIVFYTFWTSENNYINNKEQGYIQLGCNKSPLLPSHSLRMVERKEWLAQPPNNVLDALQTPVPYVIITHTATEGCINQSSCIFHVRYIQSFHIESRHWNDIGYNFLVGGDGSAYEGRGWNYVGAHTKSYNFESIGIALIGTFTVMDPPERQYVATKRLIELGVKLGKIAKDYKLYAHRQLIPTASPGDRVYTELQKWPHFSTDTPTMQ